MKTAFHTDHKFAYELDAIDPLRTYRDHFYLDKSKIYLDGNSLGLLSKSSEKSLLRVIAEWKKHAIDGWTKASKPWFSYAEELARQQAPLLGAKADEIILHASTTINIHLLLAAFYKPSEQRNKILIDQLTFPSDRYAVESQLELKGQDVKEALKIINSRDGRYLNEEDIIAAMTDDVAVIFLPSVLYRSAQLLDMALLTAEAHRRGILIGFDCAHSVGAVPHLLSEWQVDFACWCNYKHCNGGPGAAAGIYINEKHFNKKPALCGWFGFRKERQFDMLEEFEGEKNAGGWQIGTPHILSLAPLEGSLKLFNKAGIEKIRKKSLLLTNYLIFLVDTVLSEYGFFVGSPRNETQRGGHVALEHKKAVQINAALKDHRIITDFRFPNIIRIAPLALYNSFNDVWRTVHELKKIMEAKKYKNYPDQRATVA